MGKIADIPDFAHRAMPRVLSDHTTVSGVTENSKIET